VLLNREMGSFWAGKLTWTGNRWLPGQGLVPGKTSSEPTGTCGTRTLLGPDGTERTLCGLGFGDPDLVGTWTLLGPDPLWDPDRTFVGFGPCWAPDLVGNPNGTLLGPGHGPVGTRNRTLVGRPEPFLGTQPEPEPCGEHRERNPLWKTGNRKTWWGPRTETIFGTPEAGDGNRNHDTRDENTERRNPEHGEPETRETRTREPRKREKPRTRNRETREPTV